MPFQRQCAILTNAAAAIAIVATSAHAQQTLTAEDIVNSLQASATGTSPSSSTLTADQILERLQNQIVVVPATPSSEAEPAQSSRSMAAVAGETVDDLPSLDLEVYFDYDSAAIKPESMPTLIELGKALTDPQIGSNRFIVVGHTDAAGSNEYNLRLSQARAESVRDFLIRAFPVEGGRLTPFGFGEEQLRDPANPEAAINRRVQVLNIAQ